MQSLIIIEYLAGFLAFTYIGGLILMWSCELKRNVLYRQMQKQIRSIENLHLSMAVLHVKTYKISRDYYKKIDKIECIQHFILKKMLYVPTPKCSLGKIGNELFLN